MKNATVMNEVQEIQKILEEHLGNRNAAKFAIEISAILQKETQHTHSGETFFVHKDDAGKLVLAMETAIKENVQAILNPYLEEEEVQKCIEQIMARNYEIKATEFETIKIPGSDSPVYAKLMKHKPVNNTEEIFMDNLKKAISKSIKEFEVFVNDPSIDNNDKLQFIPNFIPAVGYSYNEWEELAKKNGLRLGTKDEYTLFSGWLINSLINEGWTVSDAWNSVCTDSRELGNYYNSEGNNCFIEDTGSRKVAGKCDLANVKKILAKDEEAGGYYLAGGCFRNYGNTSPLASIDLHHKYFFHYGESVGWFVL